VTLLSKYYASTKSFLINIAVFYNAAASVQEEISYNYIFANGIILFDNNIYWSYMEHGV
jgi:hypothetical protein